MAISNKSLFFPFFLFVTFSAVCLAEDEVSAGQPIYEIGGYYNINSNCTFSASTLQIVLVYNSGILKQPLMPFSRN